MDFSSCLNEFDKYVSNYDLKILENKYKYDHTLRVVDFAKIICQNEKCNEEETSVAIICSLLHDIARFEEWTRYHSWNEIDHGDLGFEILSNNDYVLKYVSDKYKTTVLSTVKYHNKIDIPDNLDNFTLKILKIVRDADKLDILNTQYNPYNDKSLTLNLDYTKKYNINDSIVENFINEKMLERNKVNNTCEDIVFYLSYLFDINYRTSFKIIYDLNIVNIKLELLKKVMNDDEKYKILEIKAKDYLESNIKL